MSDWIVALILWVPVSLVVAVAAGRWFKVVCRDVAREPRVLPSAAPEQDGSPEPSRAAHPDWFLADLISETVRVGKP